MRVLLLNYEYPPLGGGAGVATQALARGLAGRGVTVDVITSGDHEDQRSEVLWDGHAQQEGLLTVYRVKSNRTGVHQAGRVDDGNGGVAPVGGAGPGEALMASAVGVLEVPLEGLSRLPSQHQSR